LHSLFQQGYDTIISYPLHAIMKKGYKITENNIYHFKRICVISNISFLNNMTFTFSAGTFLMLNYNFFKWIYDKVDNYIQLLNYQNSYDINWCSIMDKNPLTKMIRKKYNACNYFYFRSILSEIDESILIENGFLYSNGCIEHAFERFFGFILMYTNISKKTFYI